MQTDRTSVGVAGMGSLARVVFWQERAIIYLLGGQVMSVQALGAECVNIHHSAQVRANYKSFSVEG